MQIAHDFLIAITGGMIMLAVLVAISINDHKDKE